MPSSWAELCTPLRLSLRSWHGSLGKSYGGEDRAIEEDLLEIFGDLKMAEEIGRQKREYSRVIARRRSRIRIRTRPPSWLRHGRSACRTSRFSTGLSAKPVNSTARSAENDLEGGDDVSCQIRGRLCRADRARDRVALESRIDAHNASMTTRRPLGLSLIAGMFGGLLVVAVVLVVVAASGGVGSSAKTVVVQ